MHGILPLWKPKGMTSHDCVMKIRKLLKTKKVGHTGTLDPEVSGVLVLCVGQATKIVPYLTDMPKTYHVTCSLGITTETEDAYGEVIEEMNIIPPPTFDDIAHVVKQFVGDITQIPPMYSAVRVKGKRLYEYARENISVERPKRRVTIFDIKELKQSTNHPERFSMTVTCSKGTYMRTLCVDIGRLLGYPAHMSDLVRTKAGSFSADETVDFTEIERAIENGESHLLLHPIESGLQDLYHLVVDDDMKVKVLHGQKFKKPYEVLETNPFVIEHNNQALAIYQIHPENPEQIKPVRVFSSDEM